MEDYVSWFLQRGSKIAYEESVIPNEVHTLFTLMEEWLGTKRPIVVIQFF
jgi:hypothetical protein